jgi:hypothetical protein
VECPNKFLEKFKELRQKNSAKEKANTVIHHAPTTENANMVIHQAPINELEMMNIDGNQNFSNTTFSNYYNKLPSTIKLIIDSGATLNLVSDPEYFIQQNPSSTKITCANGSTINGIGDGFIYVQINKQYVLEIPATYINKGCNIISTNVLLQNGWAIHFDNKEIIITKNNLTLMGYYDDYHLPKLVTPLIKIDELKKVHMTKQIIALEESRRLYGRINTIHDNKIPNDAKLWHYRLGHLQWSKLRDLAPQVQNLRINPKSFTPLHTPCQDCTIGKMTQRIGHTPRTRAHQPGDQMHTDICIMPAVNEDFTSFLTVIDDYSGWSNIYLLKSRGQASEYIIQSCESWFTKFNKRVKIIQYQYIQMENTIPIF